VRSKISIIRALSAMIDEKREAGDYAGNKYMLIPFRDKNDKGNGWCFVPTQHIRICCRATVHTVVEI
jgi:hypothetical protein